MLSKQTRTRRQEQSKRSRIFGKQLLYALPVVLCLTTLAGSQAYAETITGTVDASAYSGGGEGLTLNGGTIAAHSDGAIGRDIILASDGTFQVDASKALTVNGVITGMGPLTKEGGGTLVLIGVNTYIRDTNIIQGTLVVDGTLASNSVVTVYAGGRLAGTGTVGTVRNHYAIAPGQNAIGMLTIRGDYESDITAVYEANINAAGQSDCLEISGRATIQGTIAVLAEAGNYVPGTTYTLVHAGALTASNVTLTSNLAFLKLQEIVTGTDYQIIVLRNAASYAGAAQTANQGQVAAVLDRIEPAASGDMSTVFNSLSTLSDTGARRAYDQMGGYIHTGAAAAAAAALDQYTGAVAGRMNGFQQGGPPVGDAGFSLLASRLNTGSRTGNMLLAAVSQAKLEAKPQWGLWVKGYSGWGDRTGGASASQYDFTGDGLVVGFDQKLSDNLLVGAAGGYFSTRLAMQELADNSKATGVNSSLYGAWHNGPLYVNAMLTYGQNRYNSNRSLAFGSINRIASANYGGSAVSGYVEAGYRIFRDSLTIMPLVSLQSSSLSHDGFTETGADALNLKVGKGSTSALTGGLGVKLRKENETGKGKLGQELTLRWLHDFKSYDASLNAAFAGAAGNSFTIAGERTDRDRANIGLGLTWQGKANQKLFFNYDANLSSKAKDQWLSLGVRYSW